MLAIGKKKAEPRVVALPFNVHVVSTDRLLSVVFMLNPTTQLDI